MGRRLALIIANDTFDNDGLRRLAAPADDAEELRRVLDDRQIGRFDVTVLRNEPHHAMAREIARFFAERHPDDLLLLHYSGHGIKCADGELYLAGTDTSPAPALLRATAVAAPFVHRAIADCRAKRIVLLLDCCYSGAFARGLVPRGTEPIVVADAFPPVAAAAPAESGQGKVVITASSATEFAFEDDRLTAHNGRRPSVFTSALVHGLGTGAADVNRDGIVDLDELYDYVYRRVRSDNPEQTPTKVVLTSAGKLMVAWAPEAERIAAIEVLPDLARQAQAAASDEQLAAVRQLRRLLLDDDLERAAGALQLLVDLTGSDSRAVSAAATDTLQEAQLRAVPDTVEFDVGAADETAITRTVRLVGAPLALVFQASTDSRWLQVAAGAPAQLAEPSLVVTLDPTAVPPRQYGGDPQALIQVTNRIGPVRIPVQIRSLPSGPPAWWRTAWPALAQQSAVLPLAALVAVVFLLINGRGLAASAGALGVGYLLTRVGLLAAALKLMSGTGRRRAAGMGMLAASTAYLLTDALTTLRTASAANSWLEFLTTLVFVGVLGLRLWPFAAVPRRIAVRSVRERPVAVGTLVAAAGYLFLLFVAPFDDDGRSMIDLVGLPAALTSFVAFAGLATACALTASASADQRTFVTATMITFFVPEVVLLAGSFLLGQRFTYVGATTYGSGYSGSATWFVVIQIVLVTALVVGTRAVLRPVSRARGR